MKRRRFLHLSATGATLLSLTPSRTLSEWKSNRNSQIDFCNQSKREIPIIYEVDVIIIGGSTGAVASAVKASENLAKVCLITDLTYLGEDICGTYQFWPQGEIPNHPIAEKIYKNGIPTPLHVKRTLEQELINHNIDFLYSSFVTDLVTNNLGEPAGIMIANRSGSQCIIAKTIIDATARATVARMSRSSFSKFRKQKLLFKYITVGKIANEIKSVSIRKISEPVTFEDQRYSAFEYSIHIDMKDDSFASFSQAEQVIRDLTWNPDQVDSSDILLFTPPDTLKGKKSSKNSSNSELIDIECFIPEKENRIFILGGCADIPRELAEQLLQPLMMLNIADRIGEASAVLASTMINEKNLIIKGKKYNDHSGAGDVKELLRGFRPTLNSSFVSAEKTTIPVLGIFDTIVVGGGTCGAPAAIGSARHGANTLVLEYMHGLGGTGTFGMVGRYYHGYRKGFTHEIDTGVREIGKNNPREKKREDEWVFDWKIEYYRRELRKAGGTIWFGVVGSGAYVEEGTVRGVVVSTPLGRGIVLGHTIIDSTGGADIAIAAGADYSYVDEDSVAVQGSGLPYKNFDDHYNNTDWDYIDDTDMLDVWRAFIVAKDKFKEQYDIGKLPQTRERSRIVGDFTISPLDIYNGRTYHDTISFHSSSFDTHGFTEDPFFALKPPALGNVAVTAFVPFRSLLPKGLEGIVVTGLGASAHRDAMPVIRMQACLQNQGYAIGWAASIAVKNKQNIRHIDLRPLQEELVKIESLPKSILTSQSNFPPSAEMLKIASKKITTRLEGLELVLWDINQSIPLLENEFKLSSNRDSKLTYALILGMFHNDTGWKTLQEKIDTYETWDKGWEFKAAGGQFGASMSYLDSLIIAMGKTRKNETLPSIIRLAKKLTPESEFSHFRAVAKAMETIGSPNAAITLHKLLQMEGMKGHSMPDIETTKQINEKVFSKRIIQPNLLDNVIRKNALRELILGRALYRCGDYKGLGKSILTSYSRDLRGHFYRHAYGVLKT